MTTSQTLTIDQKLDFIITKVMEHDQRFDILELNMAKFQKKTMRRFKEIDKRFNNLQDMMAADLSESNQRIDRVENVLHLPRLKIDYSNFVVE